MDKVYLNLKGQHNFSVCHEKKYKYMSANKVFPSFFAGRSSTFLNIIYKIFIMNEDTTKTIQ